MRRGGGGGASSSSSSIKPSLLATLVPAALLGFGAFALLLAHQSIQSNSAAEIMAGRFPFDGSNTQIQPLMATIQERLFLPQQSSPKSTDYFVQFPPDAYEDAFYLDDEPDYDTPHMTYQDEHVKALMQNSSFVPFNIYRNPKNATESVLHQAGAHPVLTALRDLQDTEEFFNPVCFRYRFPNISMFPTISVIVPMQNGMCASKRDKSGTPN